MWSLVIDLKGNEFVWSFNYLNGQFLEDFLENIFVVGAKPNRSKTTSNRNRNQTKPKPNQTESKPKQKHTKPELWIFFCDVIVVGDTKIFKPGPVDAVWGLNVSPTVAILVFMVGDVGARRQQPWPPRRYGQIFSSVLGQHLKFSTISNENSLPLNN